MNDKFSLEPEQSGQLAMFDEKPYTTYNNDYTDTKANRFSLVLGQDSPGPDVVANSIAVGDQDRWAQIIKTRQDTANSQRRNDIIREIATARGPNVAPSPDDIAVVTSLADDQLYSADLNTILEEQYSNFFTNTISALPENAVIADARAENDDKAMEILDRAQFAQQRSLLAQDKLGEIQKRYEDAGLLEKGVGFLKGVIPGYSWWKTVDRIESAPTVSLLSGNNLGEQIAYLYSLPPAEFKETLSKAVDELADDNVVQAMDFASAVVSYSTDDANLASLFDVLDVADVATLGAGAAIKGGLATTKLAKGMAKSSKAILANPKNVARQAAEVGLPETSAIGHVVEDTLAGDFSGLATINNIADVEERLPSIFSPQKVFTGASRLESTANNRLRETILRSSDLAQKFLTQGRLVDRLEPSQIQLAAKEAFDKIQDTFTNVNHNIVDMQVIPASQDLVTNTAQVAVKFGRRDGSLFKYEATAKNFADKYIGLKTNDFTIEQDGIGGYFIQVTRPVADVGDFRKLEIDTTLATPNSLSNQFLTYLRSADYKLPEQNVMARGRVVHGQEMLADYMKNVTEPFRGKSKEWTAEMDKVFKSNRASRKYYNTVEEFENSFLAMNGKAPTEDQASAYFTYVQLNDLDYLLRDADIVKQKIRLGGEKFSFKVAGDDGVPTISEFDGRAVDNLPYDAKSPYTVRVIKDNKITTNTSSRFFNQAKREEFDNLLSQGYKIILNPEEATYYFVKDFKRDRIPLGQLNRVEGGHNEYKYSHFIKQADVKTGADRVARYRGDKSLFVATTEKQAREIGELFEKARIMVRDKDANAAKFIDENLPITYGDFIKKTKTGDINLNLPIMSTMRGQRTADLHDYTRDFEFFDDATTSEHNIFGQVGGRYTTERADSTLDVLRAENGVVFRTDLEPLLDPMETLRSSTANMLDVRLVNDYRQKSTADWVQEFGSLLDAHPNKVAANPMHYLQNPVYRTGANPERVRLAQNVRDAVLTLNNYRNPVESSVQVYKEKILSSVYDISGEKGRQFVDDHLLADANDVTTFMRAAAFNMKLGMFNPKQLFLQASTAINIMGVSNKGIAGVRAMPVTRMALRTDNPQVLNGLANKWAKFMGWEKQDWLDMVESYKQSGFATVSNDVAYLDDFRPKTMKSGSKLGQVWEHHTVFFKEGELVARNVAYSTAWREWKDANPGKAMDRFAESKILQRAKNLTTNMTRDSNAAWQKGWTSVGTQFMGYQARFMEQLWDGGLLKDGRKLSSKEKMRLMATMSTIYGSPVLIGGSTGVIPMRDMIRDWMNEDGVAYDDTLLEPFLDGFIPTIGEAMTGMDMNWSEAYGPNGLPTLKDMWDGDKGFADILLGASGGVIADTMSSSLPAVKGIVDMVNPGADSTWPVLMEDLLEPLKNVSTVNSAVRLFEGLNTHRYLSRKGTHLTNVSTMEAVTTAIMGVNPDRVSEAYSQIAAVKSTKEMVQGYQNEIQKNFKLAIQAAGKGDEESAEVYFSRAHSAGIRGGLSPSEINLARKRALDEQPMDENVFQTFEKRVLQRRQNQPTETTE